MTLKLRVLSTLLALLFSLEQVAFAASEVMPKQFNLFEKPIIDLKLPESIASVEDSWKAPNSDRLVYLIQDAHTNESGQINLAKVLDILFSKDQIKYIFVEAGLGDNSLTFLREHSSLQKRKQVATEYLKKGILHGEEYLDLTSDHDFTIWGVEDFTLYQKAIDAYRAVVKDREKFQNYLSRIQSTINTLKPRIFNPSLLSFDEKHSKFLKEETSLTDYFQMLTQEADKQNISLLNFPHLKALNNLRDKESKIDFKLANDEQQKAIQSLSKQDQAELQEYAKKEFPFKLGNQEHKEQRAFYTLLESVIARSETTKQPSYPELSKYFSYLKESKTLNPSKILAEQKQLENELFDSLAKTPDEKLLTQSQASLRLLQKLFDLKLTPDEYQEYKQTSKDFTINHMTGFLNKKIMNLQSFYERAMFLEEGYDQIIQNSETFYGLTKDRDEAFLRTLSQKMTEEKQSQAVLITGGFHTTNLKALFRKQNISYVSITPQVYQETNQKRYERLLLNQKIDPNLLAPTPPHTQSMARLPEVRLIPDTLSAISLALGTPGAQRVDIGRRDFIKTIAGVGAVAMNPLLQTIAIQAKDFSLVIPWGELAAPSDGDVWRSQYRNFDPKIDVSKAKEILVKVTSATPGATIQLQLLDKKPDIKGSKRGLSERKPLSGSSQTFRIPISEIKGQNRRAIEHMAVHFGSAGLNNDRSNATNNNKVEIESIEFVSGARLAAKDIISQLNASFQQNNIKQAVDILAAAKRTESTHQIGYSEMNSIKSAFANGLIRSMKHAAENTNFALMKEALGYANTEYNHPSGAIQYSDMEKIKAEFAKGVLMMMASASSKADLATMQEILDYATTEYNRPSSAIQYSEMEKIKAEFAKGFLSIISSAVATANLTLMKQTMDYALKEYSRSGSAIQYSEMEKIKAIFAKGVLSVMITASAKADLTLLNEIFNFATAEHNSTGSTIQYSEMEKIKAEFAKGVLAAMRSAATKTDFASMLSAMKKVLDYANENYNRASNAIQYTEMINIRKTFTDKIIDAMKRAKTIEELNRMWTQIENSDLDDDSVYLDLNIAYERILRNFGSSNGAQYEKQRDTHRESSYRPGAGGDPSSYSSRSSSSRNEQSSSSSRPKTAPQAAQDYYTVLGISRAATAKEIKSAYRKKALETHPDRNPGDRSAEARFKVINEANGVLSDPEKRAKYDRFGAGARLAEADSLRKLEGWNWVDIARFIRIADRVYANGNDDEAWLFVGSDMALKLVRGMKDSTWSSLRSDHLHIGWVRYRVSPTG